MAKKKSKAPKTSAPLLPDTIAPTPERYNQGPLVPYTLPVDGRIVRTQKALDRLEAMRRNGSITDDEHGVGLRFQRLFDMANRDYMTSINMDSVGGGGVTREQFMDRQLDARKKLDRMYDLIGGERSRCGISMTQIVARNWSLNEMIKFYGHPAHYWRGALASALEILANEERKKAARRSQGCAAKNAVTTVS